MNVLGISDRFYSHALSPILWVLYLFWFGVLAKRAKTPLFFGLALIPLMFGVRGFLSLYLIETGYFIPEVGLTGFVNGSTPLFFGFASLALLILWLATRNEKVSDDVTYVDIYDVFFLTIFAIEFIAAQVVRINFNLSDRFNFYGASNFTRLFLFIDVMFVGLFWAVMFRKAKFAWLWCGLFILVGLSKNSSFSAIRSTLELAAVVLFAKGILKPRHLFPILTIGFVSVAVKLHSFDWHVSRLLERFAMDNHVFWGTINLWHTNSLSLDLSTFWQDFWNVSLTRANSETGFGELMTALSPALAPEFFKHNVRFTCGFPAILIFKLGLLAAVPAFISICWGYWAFYRYLLRSIFVLHPVLFIGLYKVFNLVEDFFIMGEYTYFRAKLLSFTLFIATVIFFAKRVRILSRFLLLPTGPSV